METAIDPRAETARILEHLREVLARSGLTASEIEAGSGLGDGELARILAGEAAFEFCHLVAVLEAIGVGRPDFFADLYC